MASTSRWVLAFLDMNLTFTPLFSLSSLDNTLRNHLMLGIQYHGSFHRGTSSPLCTRKELHEIVSVARRNYVITNSHGWHFAGPNMGSFPSGTFYHPVLVKKPKQLIQSILHTFFLYRNLHPTPMIMNNLHQLEEGGRGSMDP